MPRSGYFVFEWSNCIDAFTFFQLAVVWQDSHVPLKAPLCGSVWQSVQASNLIPVNFAAAALEVATAEDALEGARHIVAETISENANVRKALRQLMFDEGMVVSKKALDAVDELAGEGVHPLLAGLSPLHLKGGQQFLLLLGQTTLLLLVQLLFLRRETGGLQAHVLFGLVHDGRLARIATRGTGP